MEMQFLSVLKLSVAVVCINQIVLYTRNTPHPQDSALLLGNDSQVYADNRLIYTLLFALFCAVAVLFFQRRTSSSVPSGFIYVQFPDQEPPQLIFVNQRWADVSGDYAGLFFRAEGGSAKEFGGGDQPETCPRISEVGAIWKDGSLVGASSGVILPSNDWSGYIWSGHYTSFHARNYYDRYYSLRFKIDGTEVRPKNTTVKIWKCVA